MKIICGLVKIAYATQVARSWCLVDANHKSDNIDEIGLDETLVKECVKHGRREDTTRSKWQPK